VQFLLINSNLAVSRLIGLSIEKLGYDIDEFNSDDLDLDKTYDVTIVDSESASNDSINLLKEDNKLGLIIYIGPRGSEKPDFADLFLQKPFLPTDFVDMIKKIDTTDVKKKEDEEPAEGVLDDDINEEIDSGISLDLDEIDSLKEALPNDEDSDDQEGEEPELDEELKDDLDKEESSAIEEVEDTQEDNTTIQSDDLDEKEPDEDEMINEGNLEENASEDVSVSILDSEDINEVKQLLEDEESDEDLESADDEKDDLKEVETQDLNLGELETDENSDEDNIDIAPDDFDLELPEEIKPEVDDEEESNEETIEEDLGLDNFDDEIEEIDEISKDEVREKIEKEDISSIDDLNEDDFNGVFEMQENPQSSGINTEIDDIKDELTQTISKDVKNILNKDEIKDALKGLKVNISISFDEE